MNNFSVKVRKLNEEIMTLLGKDPNKLPILDGPIDADRYDSARPRILFVLKEPYSKVDDRGGWSVTDSLNEKMSLKEQAKEGRPTFEPMVIIANMLARGCSFDEVKQRIDTSEVYDLFKKHTAYINVSKLLNRDSSSTDDKFIEMKGKENASILKAQVDLYQPDVVILGGTIKAVKNNFAGRYSILGEMMENASEQREGSCIIHHSSKRLYLEVYHPSYASRNLSRLTQQTYCEEIAAAYAWWKLVRQ